MALSVGALFSPDTSAIPEWETLELHQACLSSTYVHVYLPLKGKRNEVKYQLGTRGEN